MKKQQTKNKKQPSKKLNLKLDSNLKLRLISSIFLVLFAIIYVGLAAIYTQTSLANREIAAWFNYALTLGLVAGAMFELLKALQVGKDSKWWYLLGIVLAEVLFIFPLNNRDDIPLYHYLNLSVWTQWYVILLFIILIITSFFALGKFTTGKYKLAFFLVLYTFIIVIGFRGFTTIALSLVPFYGFNTIVFLWLTIILTDSFAYLGGRRFGKTKMAPNVSPNKTWEGAAIGTTVGVVLMSLYGSLFFYFLPSYSPFSVKMVALGQNAISLPGIMFVLLSLLAAIAGQLGDLLFSYLKRVLEIKDYSKLIPGHGGILDRLDSFLMVFSIMYFIILSM